MSFFRELEYFRIRVIEKLDFKKRISLSTDFKILMLIFHRPIGFKGNTIKEFITALLTNLNFTS